MLHPGEPPAVRHRFVERVLRGIGAEQFAVAGAEALDAVLVHQRFGGGEQQVAVDPLHRALGGGIEQAQALQLVAEEIEPQAGIEAGGEDVDDRAAHREFAVIDHRVGAAVALPGEQRGEAFVADLRADAELAHGFAHPERGEHALEHGVDGGDQQLRLRRPGLQAVKRGQPFGTDRERGAGAVIGQAVPCRELDHLDFGREEPRSLRRQRASPPRRAR